MFEEIVNRRSRWRVFWPDVGDLSGAHEAIRLAVWFTYLVAGLTAVATLIGAMKGANVAESLLSVAIFGIIGLGVQRKWRTAAVAGAALMVLGLIETLSRGVFPGVIAPFVLIGLVNGIRGTFAAKRLSRSTEVNGSGTLSTPEGNDTPDNTRLSGNVSRVKARTLARLAVVGVLVVFGVGIAMLMLGKRTELGSNWTIDGIRFETTGWQLREATADAMVWASPEGDVLSLNQVAGKSDVLAATDLASLRAHCRRLASVNGGSLVNAAFVGRGQPGIAALIYKREQLPAYAYTGVLFIPHGPAHYVLTVASVERGTTGVRDALVTAQLMQQGKLDPTKTDANRRVQGWFRDPYDPKYDGTTIHSVADEEEYDAIVPLHPLSKVRATLRTIERSLRVQ